MVVLEPSDGSWWVQHWLGTKRKYANFQGEANASAKKDESKKANASRMPHELC
jgi:hypothetical protein